MNEMVDSALKIALSQEGIREEGDNRGPQVDEYLRSVGAAPGNPWCAAFVCWCIDRACSRESKTYPFVRTAYCPDIAAWARGREILMEAPQIGDVFLRFGTVGAEYRACHTGFVTSVAADSFATIEGNTNLDGSREGIGVFRRTRPISSSYKFVRWEEVDAARDSETYRLLLFGEELCVMPVVDGRSQCPVRLWGENLGFKVSWENENQVPTFDGKEVATPITLIGGKAYAPIRDLAAAAGLRLSVDSANRCVLVVR